MITDNNDEIFGKKINTVVLDNEPNIGVDLDSTLVAEILSGASGISMQKIQQFTQISQRRDQLYDLIDSMCEDSQVAQALDIYVQCATERNDNGDIVWCTSTDENVQKYVGFLLDSLNIDKNIYKWVECLAKYGDAYLQIFRESEMENDLFKKKDEKRKLNESANLNEDVLVKAFSPKDKYAHYVELHSNPAEIFELTKHGKTYGYVEAPVVNSQQATQDMYALSSTYSYKFHKQDVYLSGADEYVHASLDTQVTRQTEQVSISDDDTNETYTYTVKRGKSILYNAFKAWRLLSLLENSLVLNRLTKSSVVRIVGVKVGDMPKEEVQKHLYGVKQMIEQKSALNVGGSLEEYNNPGPMENFIITPVRDNDQGNIISTTIGGDVDVKGLADIDMFKNKFYGALGIPKQYMGDTDDSAGFDAGKSLSLISSVFAKAVKRIQSSMIEALTDLVNLMLIDKGLLSYVNMFKIHMQEPTTQEQVDRVEARANALDQINTIMNILADVNSESSRLVIVKSLLSDVISNQAALDELGSYIESLEQSQETEQTEDVSEEQEEDIEINNNDLNSVASAPNIENIPIDNSESTSEVPNTEDNDTLPDIPADMDMTDNTQF